MSLNKDGFEYLSIDETITFISKNYNIALHAQTIRQAIYDNQIQSIKHGKYIYIAKEMVDYYINNVYRINRIFDKAKVLVFANHKGGVGKTISAFNVAAVLEENHHKVLMIDFDPQASLSLNANIDIDNTPSIYNLLMKEIQIKEAIYKISRYRHIIPSYKNLSLFERYPREYIYDTKALNNIIKSIETDYDFIIIDCPPQLSLLTSTAINTGNYLYIPILSDLYSLEGLRIFIEYALTENPNINIGGIYITRYNSRRKADSEVKQYLDDNIKDYMFTNMICESTDVTNATLSKKSVIEYKVRSNVSRDFRNLTNEIIEGIS